MVFFEEIHLLFQLRGIHLFGANRAYLHFEIPKLEEVLLQKQTQFSQGNHMLHATASKQVDFFREIHVFHQLC
jgi:hypothetical protein